MRDWSDIQCPNRWLLHFAGPGGRGAAPDERFARPSVLGSAQERQRRPEHLQAGREIGSPDAYVLLDDRQRTHWLCVRPSCACTSSGPPEPLVDLGLHDSIYVSAMVSTQTTQAQTAKMPPMKMTSVLRGGQGPHRQAGAVAATAGVADPFASVIGYALPTAEMEEMEAKSSPPWPSGERAPRRRAPCAECKNPT